jgi:hypothetical protein
VKTWVKNDMKSENVTFFTARNPAVSWVSGPGTASDRPMGEDSVTYDADYRMDGTSWFRHIHGKKAPTSPAGSTRLSRWN